MDRYTKTMLTLMTICLAWIALRGTPLISDAIASAGVVEVKIVDISSYRSLPVKAEGEMTCKLK
jgi:hypothetical protein